MNAILRMVVDVALPLSPDKPNESGGVLPWVIEKSLDLTQIPRVGDRVMIQGDKATLIPYVNAVYWLYPELVLGATREGLVIILGLNRPIISVEEQLIRSFFEK